MRIIPVVDVKGGQAVHAIAGDRAHYQPLRSVVHPGTDPLAIARALRETFGFAELYLADLDAIAGAPPALPLYRKISGLGVTLWLDAGARDRLTADACSALIHVLGLETLAGAESLRAIVAAHGPDRLAFSLDLRDGVPITATGSNWPSRDPFEMARIVLEIGVKRIILLDLGRVGTGTGLGPLRLLDRVRAHDPEVEIIVGGGIVGEADLVVLKEHGATAALVGTALHRGVLSDGRLAILCGPGEVGS